MGQIISNDPYSYLTPQPNQLNSQPKIKQSTLKTASLLRVPFYDIVYKQEDDRKLEYVYKFMHNRYVSLYLTKKLNKQGNSFTHSTAGGELLYGYKIKYRYKTNDKIKNVLLKKRIHGERQQTINVLAQLKLLSILQVGPYVGTMIDGSDGFVCKGYLEYYAQNLLNFKSNVGELFKKLSTNFGKVEKERINNLGFSVSYHDIVLKPEFVIQSNKMQQQPVQTHLPLSSLMPMTNSQNFKMSTIEDLITKQIKLIDEKSNSISAIENCLIHKNIEKAITLYEESLKKLNNPNEKFKHIFNFLQLLSDSGYFKQYEEQIVTEALDDSQLESEHLLNKNEYRKELEQKVNILKLQSKQFSSQSEIDQFSHTYSINDSDVRKEKLKINIQDSNNMRVKQLMRQMNKNAKTTDTFNEQVSFEYASMLMKSGKSRLALSCFEILLRSDKVSTHTKFRICGFMGLIYYYKCFYALARKQFERSISKILKMRYYSPALVLAYNNIGCAFYQQFKYEQSLQCYNCALSLLNWTNDYEAMLRNNRGITYLKLGMIKQAKEEFMVIINKGEPINNASILCKIYTNLGFMSMKSKQFGRAKDDFKMAIEIQQRCLIPNGYRPSPYLHNNMAMVRFKLKQFRQALDHFNKYMGQFQNLKSLEGVMVNYNIALAYKQCYKNQFATQHIEKCRRLLLSLPQKYKLLYEKKIQIQADNISRNNIDQASDQSSGAVIDNMISTLTRKN